MLAARAFRASPDSASGRAAGLPTRGPSPNAPAMPAHRGTAAAAGFMGHSNSNAANANLSPYSHLYVTPSSAAVADTAATPLGATTASVLNNNNNNNNGINIPSASSSPSGAAAVDALRADNKLLAMKLRYMQSVTTIYRQRVAAITKDALIGMGFGAEGERRITQSIADAEAVALGAMRQFEGGEAEGGGLGGVGSPSYAADGSPSSSPTRAAQTRAMLYGPSPAAFAASSVANSAAANNNSNGSSAEADFWRQQFLNLMSEMRPVSMEDAEILMKAIADKKGLADEVDALRAQLAANGSAAAAHLTPARRGGVGADVASLTTGASPAPRHVPGAAAAPSSTPIGAHKEGLVSTPAPSVSAAHHPHSHQNQRVGMVLLTTPSSGNNDPAANYRAAPGAAVFGNTVTLSPADGGAASQYPSTAPSTLAEALRCLAEEQTRGKVLRVRLSTLQKEAAAQQEQFSADLIAARTENLRVVSAMKALEADRTALAAQSHEHKQKAYLAEKAITVRDGQLSRQSARATALEKELQAAVRRMQTVFAQEDERRAAEAAALQQSFDERRQLETEATLLKANLESARREVEDGDVERQRLATLLRTSDGVNAQLRAEINAMEQHRLMTEWEADSMLSLLPRMDEATTELEQFFTFREVKIECERINGQLRTINSIGRSLLELNKVIERRNAEIRLLRAEADRAVSLGVPPSIGAIVDTQIVDGAIFTVKPNPQQKQRRKREEGEESADEGEEGAAGAVKKGPRTHVLLRQQGAWMEIRDAGSGKVRYITSDASVTPFAAVAGGASTAEERAEEAKALAEAAERTRAALAAKAEAEEAARTAEAVAAAVAAERARVLAEVAAAAEEAAASGKGSEALLSAVTEAVADSAAIGGDDGEEADDDLSPLRQKPRGKKKAPVSCARFPDAPIDPTYRPRLIRFFSKYNPQKLNTIDVVMDRFRGRYESMIAKLVAKYGPEPPEPAPGSGEPDAALAPLPPQLTDASSLIGSSRASHSRGGGDSDEDADNNEEDDRAESNLDFVEPLKARLIRLLDHYDKPRLAAVDAYLNGWLEEGLAKLVAQYGTEPLVSGDRSSSPTAVAAGAADGTPSVASAGKGKKKEAPLPALPPQQRIGVDPAKDLQLEPHRRRLIRVLAAYDADRLCAVDALVRAHPTPLQMETLLKKLAVRYGPEPVDDEDAKVPTLPPQVAEVPPITATTRAAPLYQSAPTVASVVPGGQAAMAQLREAAAATTLGRRSPGASVVAGSPARGATATTSPASPSLSTGAAQQHTPLTPPRLGDSAFGSSTSQPPAAEADAGLPQPPADVKARLYRMFSRYAPDKLGNIDLVLTSFEGEYELMFKKLVAKYGPEPPDDGAPMPDVLPAQVVNPVLAARRRTASMRQPAPPASAVSAAAAGANLPPRRTPVVSVSSPSQEERSASPTVHNVPPTRQRGQPLSPRQAPPAAALAASAAEGSAANKAPTTHVDPSKSTAAAASPSPTRAAAKAPPAAAIAAMKARAASPAGTATPTASSAGAERTATASPARPAAAAKAPPAAAIAAMKAAADKKDSAASSRAASPAGPAAAAKAPPAAAIAAMKAAAEKKGEGSSRAASPSAPATGGDKATSPRPAKAPPAAAIAAMKKAAAAPRPAAINTDDI